jgi:glycosyltransferase involved in cell wall biosynthesis
MGRAIAALQREVGADLVHLNQPGEGAFLDVDVPVVVAAHSCLGTWWRSVLGGDPDGDWRWRAELEAAAFRRADIVAAPTVSHAEAVAAAYGIRLPVVVPNASVASSGPVRDRTPTVVAAARWWDAGKNLAVLDQAASACRWPVLLFGSLEGPDGTAVCARHARPLGPRPSDEVHQAMRRAALFASPSLYEPFGLAALEAARSGAALVLADIPTYREIWDGAACFFDPRAPAALANALDRLTRDGGERARLAAAAARRAATFTPNAQVAALGRVYDAAGATLQPAS